MGLAAGTRIGKYVVERELGHGGFGVIYVGRDSGLDRDVAIKVLRSEHVSRPDIVQRFLQEARAAAKIDHPGIVTVFECGVTDDGTVYIAMELLRGETLAERLKRGRVPIAMALGLAQQAAAALGAAHRAGIVHRDLKPDNLFLCPDRAVLGGERVKVLDFGIAKLAESARPTELATQSMMLLGTPMFMSPEQCKSSARVDARSDIYTLGCIVFELACGKTPYSGEPGELIAMHQLAPVPSARQISPDVPGTLDSLLAAMLAKAPEDRPQSMEQVEAQLEACIADGDHQPTRLLESHKSPVLERRVRTVPHTAALRLPRRASRARRVAIVLGALAAIGTGVVIAIVSAGNPRSATAAPRDAAAVVAITAPRPPAVPPPPDAAVAVVPADAAIVPGDADDAPIVTEPTCDPAPHEKLAQAASRKGVHVKALAEAEAALACAPTNDQLVLLAYYEACAAGREAKARHYYARLPISGEASQSTLFEVCLRRNIDPRSK